MTTVPLPGCDRHESLDGHLLDER